MTGHYDALETRRPTQCEAELFWRLPDVLGKVENPIAERSFLRQLFNGAQPFVNCGGADPVHSELTARLRADYGATRSQETGSKA
jgi:hypothetical protein